MKTPWEIKIGKIAIYITILSFVIGTMLFVLTVSYINHSINQKLLTIGIRYAQIAFLINSIYLLFLIINIFRTKNHRVFLIQKTFIMLANIPIALVYAYIIANFNFL